MIAEDAAAEREDAAAEREDAAAEREDAVSPGGLRWEGQTRRVLSHESEERSRPDIATVVARVSARSGGEVARGWRGLAALA